MRLLELVEALLANAGELLGRLPTRHAAAHEAQQAGISPISPLYLPISPYISPTSRLHLPHISRHLVRGAAHLAVLPRA